jgi:hypothetical protein
MQGHDENLNELLWKREEKYIHSRWFASILNFIPRIRNP